MIGNGKIILGIRSFFLTQNRTMNQLIKIIIAQGDLLGLI